MVFVSLLNHYGTYLREYQLLRLKKFQLPLCAGRKKQFQISLIFKNDLNSENCPNFSRLVEYSNHLNKNKWDYSTLLNNLTGTAIFWSKNFSIGKVFWKLVCFNLLFLVFSFVQYKNRSQPNE